MLTLDRPKLQLSKPIVTPKLADLERERIRNERRALKRRAHETRAKLAARFPKCFADFMHPKRPLKIGIYNDLLAKAPDLGPWSLQLAIRDYVNGKTYLAACVEGAPRIDLNGDEAGFVSNHAAAHARTLLARRRQ